MQNQFQEESSKQTHTFVILNPVFQQPRVDDPYVKFSLNDEDVYDNSIHNFSGSFSMKSVYSADN